MQQYVNRSSFLSNDVYEILVTLRNNPTHVNSECITDHLTLDWKEIDSALGNISENERIIDKTREWFLDKIKSLWSIIDLSHKKFINFSPEKKSYFFSLTSWLINSKELEEITTNYLSLSDNEILLWLLKLTSHLERKLGDIYFSSGDSVPFLLKDLLASGYLERTLGRVQVQFLQLLMGCVQGLNLRNIAWHGFFSPGELHVKIIGMMLITAASLGKILNLMDYSMRQYISLTYSIGDSKLLNSYYSDFAFNKKLFMNKVQSCGYISSNHWCFWEYAFDLLKYRRFGDCLIFIMPLIENLLRLVYCDANNCLERALTADSSAYYITLDDILAQKTSEDEDNKLQDRIGTKLFIMLLDYFVYLEGPRFRDRLSHCEIDVNEIPLHFAGYTFGLASTLISTISGESLSVEIESNDCLQCLTTFCEKYRPLYHPSSLLIRSIIILEERLAEWDAIQVPSELKMVNDVNCIKEMNDLNETNGLFIQIKLALKTTDPLTIFRPKAELELVGCLHKIVSNMEIIDTNIVTNFKIKYEQWSKREMKSRTRDNYKRLISCLPVLQYGLAFLLNSMLNVIDRLKECQTHHVKCFIRTYKHCLQYVENVASMSSSKKNRWNEITEATTDLIKFIENNEQCKVVETV